MSACLERERLAGLAMLDARDPERAAANAHAAGCERCAAALREAEATLAPLAGLRAEPPRDLAALETHVLAALADDARKVAREGGVVVLGAAISLAISFAIFPIASRGLVPRVEGLLALAVAVFAALFARTAHRARLALGMVIASSLSMIAIEVDGDAAAAADHGIFCSAVVGAAAIVPALFAGWLAVRTLEPGAGWRMAARAGAAALAAQGALAVLCTNHGLLHLVPFHFLALVAAMVVGGALPLLYRRLRPA